jgi:hypothetical protein
LKGKLFCHFQNKTVFKIFYTPFFLQNALSKPDKQGKWGINSVAKRAHSCKLPKTLVLEALQ